MQPDLSPLYNLIESCIADLGVDPTITRGSTPGQWSLTKGSAKVYIDVWYIEREERPYFQVMCPVMPIPATRQLEFYQELLELNDKLFGVAFTIYNGWAWVKHIRECDGLDKSEAFATITRVGNYSDQYDDVLVAKYSGGGGAPGGPGAPIHPN